MVVKNKKKLISFLVKYGKKNGLGYRCKFIWFDKNGIWFLESHNISSKDPYIFKIMNLFNNFCQPNYKKIAESFIKEVERSFYNGTN